MGLYIELRVQKWTSYNKGETWKEESECIYDGGTTHNLTKMADECDLYKALWRPDESEWDKAKDIIAPLKLGLTDLKLRPEHFKQFNSPNGWGMYEHFLEFVETYLKACEEYPEAIIEISR